MSRSRRHTPIHGITKAASDRFFKSKSNRRLRKAVRIALRTDGRTSDLGLRDVSNVYKSAKDGKSYWSPYSTRWPEGHARMMRK